MPGQWDERNTRGCRYGPGTMSVNRSTQSDAAGPSSYTLPVYSPDGLSGHGSYWAYEPTLGAMMPLDENGGALGEAFAGLNDREMLAP